MYLEFSLLQLVSFALALSSCTSRKQHLSYTLPTHKTAKGSIEIPPQLLLFQRKNTAEKHAEKHFSVSCHATLSPYSTYWPSTGLMTFLLWGTLNRAREPSYPAVVLEITCLKYAARFS